MHDSIALISKGLMLLTFLLTIWSAILYGKRKRQTNLVCQPFYVVPVALLAAMVFFAAVREIPEQQPWERLGFAGAMVLMDCMIIAYINCVVRYDDDGFTVRRIFGVRRRVGYGAVDGLRTGRSIRVFFGKRSVLLDENCTGREGFLRQLEKAYRNEYNAPVPRSPAYRRRFDPMNGHVDAPWLYFCAFLGLGLLALGIMIFEIYSLTHEYQEPELHIRSVAFRSYAYDKNDLLLYPDAEDPDDDLRVSWFADYETLPDPEQLCDGTEYEAATAVSSREICLLRSTGGEEWITPGAYRHVSQSHIGAAEIFLMLFFAICMVISGLGIAVGRHPERFGKQVKSMLYRRGDLRG